MNYIRNFLLIISLLFLNLEIAQIRACLYALLGFYELRCLLSP